MSSELAELRLEEPCLVVLVGTSGSGKSTWAKRWFAAEQVVSSDALRAIVGFGEADLSASADAFAVLEQIVRARLGRRLTTIIDSTGLEARSRRRWRQLADANDLPTYLVIIETEPAVARRRNRARSRVVPEDVLVSQRQALEAQRERFPDEGFREVLVVRPVSFDDIERSELDADPAHGQPGLNPEPAVEPRVRTVTKNLSASQLARVQPEARTHSRSRSERARSLRFGLHLSSFTGLGGPDGLGDSLRRLAIEAEAAGLSSLWLMDHLRQIPQVGRAWDDLPEPYTTLAHLAAVTSSISLGALVSPVTLRHPSVLGKAVATLDVLSSGRAVCGLGLGWFAQEHQRAGMDFATTAKRYELLEDTLRYLPVVWGKGAPSFEGKQLHVSEALCYPRPVQDRIPLLVGGSGERRTLALVARFANACNLFGEPEVVARRVAVLRAHCETAGRDPAEIEITHLSTVLIGRDEDELTQLENTLRPAREPAERFRARTNAGTIDDHARRVEALAAVGVDHVIVSLADIAVPGATERLGALIERVGR